MGSRVQEDVKKYIRSRFDEKHIQIYEEGLDNIRVIHQDGTEQLYTANIYADIMIPDGAGEYKIIAESDLEHDLIKLKYNDRPTKWKDK